jgi:magnesium chelatase family protein
VAIARAGRVLTFPSRFQLVAAMNPCPCGFAGSLPEGRCRCRPGDVERYGRRVSGPLRDRIDLWVTMPRMSASAIVAAREPEGSAEVGPRIAGARARAMLDRGCLNGQLRGRALRRACRLSPPAAARIVVHAEDELASGRGTERLLRVARTIADLDGSMAVESAHLDEAAWYRSPATRAAEALAS